MLVYTPETPNHSYAQFLIRVKSEKDIQAVANKIAGFIEKKYPFSFLRIKRQDLGPSPKAKIVARISGRDPDILRSLSDKVSEIYEKTPNAIGIRTDWSDKVKNLNLEYSEEKARFSGVSANELKDALLINFSGKEVGLYREGIDLIPILLRSTKDERADGADSANIQIWTESSKSFVPIGQVVKKIQIEFENNLVGRRNRVKTIEVLCDPKLGELASPIFNQVRPQVEALPLPPGYKIEWGGEYEDSLRGQKGVAKSIPFGALAMFFLTVFLFMDLRQAFVIWFCIPLAIIGVAYGLFFTGSSFGFMCLLGILSLSGMIIKNCIILIEEFDHQIAKGKDPFLAVLDSSITRVRPVCLTAFGTAFGLIPLLTDVFFKDMAITIIGGLCVATLLTLFVVPIMYCLVFRIPFNQRRGAKG
jgi:multidrug efflux pump subunit AcrB